MLKFGRISDMNAEKGMARVYLDGDGIVTNWLPISFMRSGDSVKVSFPLAINEHVWCIMDENCEYGVIGGAIYSVMTVPPQSADQKLIIHLSNNSQISLNVNDGTLNIYCAGDISLSGRKITLNSKTDIEMKAVSNINITTPTVTMSDALDVGNLKSNNDVTAGTISLKLHTHTSSSPGNPTTPPL